MIIKKKDYSPWFGKEWARFLDPFLQSKEYRTIGETIIKQLEQGISITPGLENIFRGFKECPWYLLHTIIIGKDVYHTTTKEGNFVADGIAFSSNTTPEPQTSLNSIYESIDRDIYDGDYTPVLTWNEELEESVCDLVSWSNQGILLINCALTTIVGRPNEHINLWKPFISYLIKEVTDKRDSLGIILLGSQALALNSLITNNSHLVVSCEHPDIAMYEKRSWRSKGVFKEIHKFQKEINNITIKW